MSVFLDDRPKPIRSISRFLTFALIVVIGTTGLTARLFYLQIVDGGRLATLATHNRTTIESTVAPRGLIYDRKGRPLVTNVATFVVKLRPSDLPLDQRETVVARLAALLHITAADINATIDGNPGFDLRPRPDRRRRRREHRPPDLGIRGRPAGGRGRRRGAPPVHRRPAHVADPRLHGAGLGRSAQDAEGRRVPPGRPDRQGRPRGAVRDAAARRLRDRERRARRFGPQDADPPDAHRRPSGRFADAHDRHEGAAVRPEGDEVGDEGSRHQAWRRDRHEPADRRGPGARQPPDVRQQRLRSRDQQRQLRQAPEEPRQAPAQPRHPGALPTRIHLQARGRHRRPGGSQDHRQDQGPDGVAT